MVEKKKIELIEVMPEMSEEEILCHLLRMLEEQGIEVKGSKK